MTGPRARARARDAPRAPRLSDAPADRLRRGGRVPGRAPGLDAHDHHAPGEPRALVGRGGGGAGGALHAAGLRGVFPGDADRPAAHPLIAYSAENIAALPLRALLSAPIALIALFAVERPAVGAGALPIWAASLLGAWLINFF